MKGQSIEEKEDTLQTQQTWRNYNFLKEDPSQTQQTTISNSKTKSGHYFRNLQRKEQ